MLALVVCGLMLTLAYPVREFVDQRSRIADLRQEQADQEQRVGELERQLQRWDDPAYVKAQARERLHYVMPGETAYVVLEPDEAPAPGSGPSEGGSGAPDSAERAWYSRLWGSIEEADSPAPAAPASLPERPALPGTG